MILDDFLTILILGFFPFYVIFVILDDFLTILGDLKKSRFWDFFHFILILGGQAFPWYHISDKATK